MACCLSSPPAAGEDLFLSAIGMSALLAGFCWPKCEPSPKWLRVLGVIAFVAVVTQGVLGGLRVTELKDQLGIFHATLAQLFFLLVSAIALFHTSFWRNLPVGSQTDTRGLRFLFVATAGLMVCQLVLGATMRHQHAGLSIPDFPTAYGKLWPKTDAASILAYNQNACRRGKRSAHHGFPGDPANGPSDHRGPDPGGGGCLCMVQLAPMWGRVIA